MCKPARAKSAVVALGAVGACIWIACGDTGDPATPRPGDEIPIGGAPTADADAGRPSQEPARDLDGLEQRADQALAELDSSPETIRGQVGGPIPIPSGLPRDLPLPVEATQVPGASDTDAEDTLVLSVAHPIDQTRGFFRAALRGRGFEILSDERSANGFELHARRPSDELVISGRGAADATQVSISTPRG